MDAIKKADSSIVLDTMLKNLKMLSHEDAVKMIKFIAENALGLSVTIK